METVNFINLNNLDKVLNLKSVHSLDDTAEATDKITDFATYLQEFLLGAEQLTTEEQSECTKRKNAIFSTEAILQLLAYLNSLKDSFMLYGIANTLELNYGKIDSLLFVKNDLLRFVKNNLQSVDENKVVDSLIEAIDTSNTDLLSQIALNQITNANDKKVLSVNQDLESLNIVNKNLNILNKNENSSQAKNESSYKINSLLFYSDNHDLKLTELNLDDNKFLLNPKNQDMFVLSATVLDEIKFDFKPELEFVDTKILPEQDLTVNSFITKLVEQISTVSKNKVQTAYLELKPEYLGKALVKISLEHTKVIVKIEVNNDLLKEILQVGSLQLKNNLAQNGFSLENFEVCVNPNLQNHNSYKYEEEKRGYFQEIANQPISSYEIEKIETAKELSSFYDFGYSNIDYLV